MKCSESNWVLICSLICIFMFGCKPEEIILHGEISGIVTDAETNQPLQTATVILISSNDSTNTGSDGKYLLKGLAPGDYQIKASKLDYAEGTNTVTVTSANTADINFELDAIPTLHFSEVDLNFGYYLSSLSFKISKTGLGSVGYMATPSKDWITVEPITGDIDSETDSLMVKIKRTGLTQPAYNEWIMIMSNYKQYDSRDTIYVYVGAHKIIFNPDLTYGTVTDNEGNVYKTIVIGTQVWMAENLKATKYNDNTPIPEVTDNTAWSKLKTPGYCWYNNDSTTYRADHGAMYNGFTVNAGKICPTGWHIPSYDEWNTLVTYIGGNDIGQKLKEVGTTHWVANTEATNGYGFTAIPGGWRLGYGNFNHIGNAVEWWTSTEFDVNKIWEFGISAEAGINAIIPWKRDKVEGYSIRCIKDAPKNK